MLTSHKKQWEFFTTKLKDQQLSHAYVFSGQDGIGKKEFALELAKLVNAPFPDLLVVKSSSSESSVKNEKDMMEIDVKQIRDVNHFLSIKSYYGGYKVIIIEHADRMNHEAQNSFLKTLEEPKGQTLIILVTSKPDSLLPTIFSRCQTIHFSPSQKQEINKDEQKLLNELLAIVPAELATKFQYTKKANLEGDAPQKILQVLQRYFRDVLLQKLGVAVQLQGSAPQYSVEKVKKIIRLIDQLYKQLSTTNANAKLALEILLMEI